MINQWRSGGIGRHAGLKNNCSIMTKISNSKLINT